MEADHAADRGPTFGALPGAGGHRAVGRALHVGHGGFGGAGSAVVGVVEVVAGVDVRLAVVVREHERVREQVLRALLVGDGRSALGIPVGHPHCGLVGAHPAVAADLRKALAGVGDVAGEGDRQVVGEVEFGDLAVRHIVARLDFRGFGGVADDFLLEEDIVGVAAGLLGELGLDGGHVGRGDVFDRVDAESVDAEVEQAVHVVGELVLHVFLAGVEVLQAGQAAVLYFVGVGVVADVLGAVVEVLFGVRDCGEVALAVVLAAGDAGALSLIGAGGVVDDRVGDDLDARRVARGDHGLELGFRTELGVELVADRLVGGPPFSALDGLHRRGDLYVAHTFGAVSLGTLLGHRIPVGLECDGDHIARRANRCARLCIGLGLVRRSRQCYQRCGRHCHRYAGYGKAFGERAESSYGHMSPFSHP